MKILLFLPLLFVSVVAYADEVSLDLDAAIANARENCAGISAKMANLKKMAGINTAVSAVGTVAGGVALGTGVVKTVPDKVGAKIQKDKLDEQMEFEKFKQYINVRIKQIVQEKNLTAEQSEKLKKSIEDYLGINLDETDVEKVMEQFCASITKRCRFLCDTEPNDNNCFNNCKDQDEELCADFRKDQQMVGIVNSLEKNWVIFELGHWGQIL